MTEAASASEGKSPLALTPEQFRDHWQGHRRLTRRVIEAFPEDRLFTFASGGMRTFGAMMGEVVTMVRPTLRGALDDVWEARLGEKPANRDDLLAAWDRTTEEIDEDWSRIPPGRLQEVVNAFGMWTQPIIVTLWYLIDNEVHHRAQGYVYLRELGVDPPPFYER